VADDIKTIVLRVNCYIKINQATFFLRKLLTIVFRMNFKKEQSQQYLLMLLIASKLQSKGLKKCSVGEMLHNIQSSPFFFAKQFFLYHIFEIIST
jgi:hypothetical protein